MLSPEQIYSNVIFGIAFGYPECCIKHFHKRQFDGTLFDEPNKKLLGSGYVCCNKCNDLLPEKEMEDAINKRRRIPGDFIRGGFPEIENNLLNEISREDKTIKLVQNIIFILKENYEKVSI